MKTVIYLDSLLLVNFVIGYFLLRAAGCVCGAPPRWPRGCLGAALAAVSTLILLAPPLPVWAQFLYQGGSALAITAAAFGWQGVRLLLRRAAWYFGMNLALAGLVLAAILRFSAQNVQTNNLAVYWNVPPLLLLFCSLGVYLLARLAVLLFGPAEPEQLWQLEAQLPGGTLRGEALWDTGFSWYDPFSGCPVVRVSAPAAQAQLEEPLQQFLQRWFGGDRAALPPPGVRLLSCDTATGGDLLPAVQAQRLRICLGKRVLLCGRVTVAFAGKPLSDGRYLALFGPGLAGQARRCGRNAPQKQAGAGCVGGPPPKPSAPAQEGRISC